MEEGVERIGVLQSECAHQLVELDALLLESPDEAMTRLGVRPVRGHPLRSAECGDPAANPGAVLREPQLARRRVRHQAALGSHREVPLVHHVLPPGRRGGVIGRIGHGELGLRLAEDGRPVLGAVVGLCGVGGRLLLRHHRAGVVDHLGDDVGRVAVEVGVLEQCGRAHVVHDLEAGLVFVRVEPGAPAHDLLELDHRTDGAEQHHVLEVLHVHPG